MPHYEALRGSLYANLCVLSDFISMQGTESASKMIQACKCVSESFRGGYEMNFENIFAGPRS